MDRIDQIGGLFSCAPRPGVRLIRLTDFPVIAHCLTLCHTNPARDVSRLLLVRCLRDACGRLAQTTARDIVQLAPEHSKLYAQN